MNQSRSPLRLKSSPSSFEEFDALPRDVRDVLNYAAFKYSTKGLAGRFNAAEMIRAVDAKGVAAAYAQRDAEQKLKELGL